VLNKFNCFDVLPVRTPYDPRIHLKKNKSPSASQTEYGKVIGCVIFHLNCTRPDIAYVVGWLSCYTHNPSSKKHWDALFRLLKYLRGIMDWCLHFSKFSTMLERLCDANWVSDNNKVRHTSGYVFTLGGWAILCSSLYYRSWIHCS